MRGSHLVEAPVADKASAREPPQRRVQNKDERRDMKHAWRGDEWWVGRRS